VEFQTEYCRNLNSSLHDRINKKLIRKVAWTTIESAFLTIYLVTGLNPFNLIAFNNTETELKLIAAAAIIGFNNGPPKM